MKCAGVAVAAFFAAVLATKASITAYPEYDARIERDYAYAVRVSQGVEKKRLVVYNHCEKSPLVRRTRGGDVNRRFCEFSFDGGPVRVDVAVCEDVKSYAVFPSRLGLKSDFKNGVVSVWVERPCNFGIRLNDSDKTILSVFAEAPEDPEKIPQKGAPGVMYVEGWVDPPGEDGVTFVEGSVKEVYVAPGAVLNSRLVVKTKGAYVHGRGMMLDPFSDVFRFDQRKNLRRGFLNVQAKNATVEDIKLVDARTFNFCSWQSGVTYRNVKALSSMMCSDGITCSGSDFTVDGAWLYVGDNALVISGLKGNAHLRDIAIGTSCNAIFPQGSNTGVELENIDIFRADEGMIKNSYNGVLRRNTKWNEMNSGVARKEPPPQDLKHQTQEFFFKNISAMDCVLFSRFFVGGNMGTLPKTFGFENVATPYPTGSDDWHAIGKKGGKIVDILHDSAKYLDTDNFTLSITNLWMGGSRLDAIPESAVKNSDRVSISVVNKLDKPAMPVVADRHEVNWTCPYKCYIGNSLQRDVRKISKKNGEQRIEQPANGENILADRPSTRSAWQRSPSWLVKFDAMDVEADARVYRLTQCEKGAGIVNVFTDAYLRHGNGTYHLSFDARLRSENAIKLTAKFFTNDDDRKAKFDLPANGKWARYECDFDVGFDISKADLAALSLISERPADEISFKNLSLVCNAQTAAVEPLCATLRADGSIRLGSACSRILNPMLFLPDWKGAQSRGGYEIKRPGVAVYRLEESKEVLADATTTLKQLDGGKVKALFSITPRKDVKTITFGCTVGLPIAEVDGKAWGINGKRGMFSKPENGIVLVRGKTTFAEFPSGVKGSRIRIEAPTPLDCLIQDNRKWGETYSIRIGDLSTRVLKAGEPYSFEFVISSDGPIAAVDQRPYEIKAGVDWIPLAERRDIVAGSALDFSGMGFADAPAGKHSWLRNVGGHFEFENLPGRPQRFYGVNLCGTANYPDHALADALVLRFRRFGYNAIRLHHHDSHAVEGSADSTTLNAANMEKLDYLVAAAVSNGLYVTTDLFVSRTWAMKWRNIGVDRDGQIDMQLFKFLCAVYDPAFENWAAFAKNFLWHENRYTGRRYVDEPAMPLLSLVNEGGFFMGWDRGVRDDPRVVASWRKWLAAKRALDPSFAPGLDGEALPKSCWGKEARPVVEQWAGELEAKMVARMKSHLRSLGCKALITNDNCGPHYTARNGMAGDYDYIDDHFYVDHPRFPEKRWKLPSGCPNVNPLIGKQPVIPVEKDFPRVAGKPFTITEWNFSGPGRYRGVGGILTGATAAMKDFDGLWRFAYSHGKHGLGDSDVRAPGYFDLASDPLALASDRASVCLFLRGDMRPGAEGALTIDRTRGSFTIDTPRTAGGFASDGAIEAGCLTAALAGAPATVCVHSLDGKPIALSRRMLLTHLTDVQGDGAKFTDESMTMLLRWGKRPLVRNGSAEIALALRSPEVYNVWELAANGARVRRMACGVFGGRLCFAASVAGPDGARMMYEIAGKATEPKSDRKGDRQ